MRPAGESPAQIEMAVKPSAVDDGADEIVGSVVKLVDTSGYAARGSQHDA